MTRPPTQYREVARRAAVWLRSVAIAGSAWAELPGDPTVPVHVGLDSGAAGIGWVLEDLARAGLDPAANRAAARSALAGLRAGAPRDRHGAFWYANRTGAALGCAPSRRGTGAQPGSPPSPPGWPDGPAAVRAGTAPTQTVARSTGLGDHRRRVCPSLRMPTDSTSPFGRCARIGTEADRGVRVRTDPVGGGPVRRLLAARPHGRDRARTADHRCVGRLRGGGAESAPPGTAP